MSAIHCGPVGLRVQQHAPSTRSQRANIRAQAQPVRAFSREQEQPHKLAAGLLGAAAALSLALAAPAYAAEPFLKSTGVYMEAG